MSCPHGNHVDACDICDEVAAAYASGVEHTKLAELEALDGGHLDRAYGYIQEALAYLEQEPVGFVVMERQPLTDEQIDNATRKQVDALLDHIYEYGTAAEGSDFRVRAIARAIEAAHGIKEKNK